MIPVSLAPEPANFDTKVRAPGLRAIAELVGDKSSRRGRRFKKVAAIREEIPANKFPPLWREALEDLLDSYNRTCAYLCLYIPRGTGAPSVDHMVAKSRDWDKVYEWSNYRLVCALMNSRKGVFSDVLDPFEVGDNWFALELVEFQVVLGPNVPDDMRGAVETTIRRLQLNDAQCCGAREEYAWNYQEGHISLDYLRRHAPFVASELHRQHEQRA